MLNCNPCPDCPPVNAINLPPCIKGEPCEEIVPVDCTLYAGPNLPALGVLNQDRLLSILTKLHKVVNSLLVTPVSIVTYTATATTVTPLLVTYLGLGPVYTSTAGATGSGTTITVGSTTDLVIGMTVAVSTGTGVFSSGTTVTAITSATQFVVSLAPTTALSGALNIIKATGVDNTIFTLSVLQNAPQSFKAFAGSQVKISGVGTIV